MPSPDQRKASKRRGVTWEGVRRLAAELPGVTEGTSYGTPALFVRKKLIARLREDGESVVVRVDPVSRDFLLAADPEMFFLTDHYRNYPWVLVALRRARLEPLRSQLEDAWRQSAGKRAVAAYAAVNSTAPG